MPTTALCSACVLSHRQQLKPAYLGSLEKRDPHTLPVPFTSCIPTPPPANTDLTSASTGGLFWRLRTARPGHWLLSPSTMLPGPSCAEEVSTSLLSAAAKRTGHLLSSSFSVTPAHVEPPCPGVKPKPSGVEAQNLGHWTTRELPICLFLLTSSLLAGLPPLFDYGE